MILPTKYEKISDNSLVLGSEIISHLLAEESIDPDTLFHKLDDSLSLIKYHDVLTFLFLLGIIEITDNNLRLKK